MTLRGLGDDSTDTTDTSAVPATGVVAACGTNPCTFTDTYMGAFFGISQPCMNYGQCVGGYTVGNYAATAAGSATAGIGAGLIGSSNPVVNSTVGAAVIAAGLGLLLVLLMKK